MALVDRLREVQAEDARRTRAAHPTGLEPGVRFANGVATEVVLQVPVIGEDEAVWRTQIHRVTGITVPAEREVQLSQVRYWGDPEQPHVYCRFLIVNREGGAGDADAVAILNALRRGKAKPATYTGDTTLCVSWNDWQVSKSAGGGTAGLAERLDAAFNAIGVRARELRRIGRDLGHLVILGGGDMVEGCDIYPNQSFEIDSDRRSQIRNTVTFILSGLDRLAPQFQRVTVLAVGGNHGEHRLSGKRVNRHDNDDCAVFEHAAVAAQRDARLAHVNFRIAQSELSKTLEVHGWVLGTTHGHIFGRAGGSVEQRAFRWYSGQAAGHNPIGDCHLLVSHHWHHYAARDWGACQWVQTPAMDGGSDFYTDYSGCNAKAGMLTWVMSPEHRFADAQIL